MHLNHFSIELFESLSNCSETIYESQLYSDLKQVVTDLLQNNIDLLFSYMYRLDIEESHLKDVLQNKNRLPIEDQLTRLIINRQIQRLKTRKKFSSDD